MKCDHCGRDIHDRDMGMVLASVVSPLMTAVVQHKLCGFCSFPLGEWLCPALKDDPTWNSERIDVLYGLKRLYGIEGEFQPETM